jgi:hypothetical protein
MIAANHSRIQQAFFSLIPPAELIEVHYKLCQALTTLYFERSPERSGDNDQDDFNIFVIPIPLISNLANGVVNMQSRKLLFGVVHYTRRKASICIPQQRLCRSSNFICFV